MSSCLGEHREQEKKCDPSHGLLCFLSAAVSGGQSCNSSLGVIGTEGRRNTEDEKEMVWLTCNVARGIVSSSKVMNGLLGG